MSLGTIFHLSGNQLEDGGSSACVLSLACIQSSQPARLEMLIESASWLTPVSYRRHRFCFRSDHNTHQHTHIILMADKHNTPKGEMHSNCMHLPDHIVFKITQRNNMRNTCGLALKLLNEEITSDIQKHKQNIWKQHLDAHWDYRDNTHTLEDHTWSIQQSTTTHTKHIHNIQQQKLPSYTNTIYRRKIKNRCTLGAHAHHTRYLQQATPTYPSVQVKAYADDITITTTHTSTIAVKNTYNHTYRNNVAWAKQSTTISH